MVLTLSSKKHLSLKWLQMAYYLKNNENQLMKDVIPGKKYHKNKDDYKFSNKNKYDTIIIDEAHEHNPNMDLILSLARNTCYFNNSIRLIIVSATMDDDEPIYRSYYNYINDNLLYPIKQPIMKHPLAEEDNFQSLAIYMDRRFHISPPGETTQYVITEVYKNLPENQESELKNSMIAQEESFNSNGNMYHLLRRNYYFQPAKENYTGC